jgi:diguanylate cyclase (GGDEF)-like protein/PAS domain S-box-containing protein
MPEFQEPDILRMVLENLHTAVCFVDREYRIRFWNEGAERVTGYQRHDVVGHSCRETVLPHCDGKACACCGATCPLARAMLNGKRVEARVELKHREGHRLPIHVWINPIRNAKGTLIGVAQSFHRQVQGSDQNRRQHNLAMYGCLDDVTGVPNQDFTQFHLRENLASFNQYQLPFGIMLVQVDALDHFLASYGKEAADAILRVTAQTLKNSLRPSDFLGRWNNNRFLVILPNALPTGVSSATERIRRLISCAGLQWWGDELMVTTSVGQAAVQGGDSVESLLERAQRSLEAKSRSAAAAASPGEVKT